MSNQTLFPHPFSKAYWRTAAAELKNTKMLVITALLIALRVALKPLAIPLGNPQLSIQTAMLATALGAMIFGPVMAIPAAIISDTIGFMIFPNGEYFLPFVLTEIASTMIYALCLYRSKVSTTRVIIARFLICFLVNMLLQTVIIAWQYTYMGNPESARAQILGIFTVARLFKNLFFFPLESVVMTLFLKALTPITNRAKLTFDKGVNLTFNTKQVVFLASLVLVGALSATGWLTYRYNGTSRTADYTDKQRKEANRSMTQLVIDKTDYEQWGTLVCVVDSEYRPMFDDISDYTISVYRLDEEAFAKGQAAAKAEGKTYDMNTLWLYKKSDPKKDPYKSLIKVGEVTFLMNQKTGELDDFTTKNMIEG